MKTVRYALLSAALLCSSIAMSLPRINFQGTAIRRIVNNSPWDVTIAGNTVKRNSTLSLFDKNKDIEIEASLIKRMSKPLTFTVGPRTYNLYDHNWKVYDKTIIFQKNSKKGPDVYLTIESDGKLKFEQPDMRSFFHINTFNGTLIRQVANMSPWPVTVGGHVINPKQTVDFDAKNAIKIQGALLEEHGKPLNITIGSTTPVARGVAKVSSPTSYDLYDHDWTLYNKKIIKEKTRGKGEEATLTIDQFGNLDLLQEDFSKI